MFGSNNHIVIPLEETYLVRQRKAEEFTNVPKD
jgi:hypothetical protein